MITKIEMPHGLTSCLITLSEEFVGMNKQERESFQKNLQNWIEM